MARSTAVALAQALHFHGSWCNALYHCRCCCNHCGSWRDVLHHWSKWCGRSRNRRTPPPEQVLRSRSSDASAAVSAGAGVLNSIRGARAPVTARAGAKYSTRGKGWCDVAGAAIRQELALRSRRAKARCTQPRATLSSRKQSRRPHEYLTPLLTAEGWSTVGPQGWSHNNVSSHVCHDSERKPQNCNRKLACLGEWSSSKPKAKQRLSVRATACEKGGSLTGGHSSGHARTTKPASSSSPNSS